MGGIICTPKSTLNTLTLQTHPIHFKRYFLLCILFYMSKLSFIKIIPLTNYFLSTPIKYSQFLCHIALRNNSQSLLRFKIGVVTLRFRSRFRFDRRPSHIHKYSFKCKICWMRDIYIFLRSWRSLNIIQSNKKPNPIQSDPINLIKIKIYKPKSSITLHSSSY